MGLLDSTMIVAGSMIGSGIYIVSADIARQMGSSGWLLATWVITGLLTVAGALSYGELAAMMPKAGGQYVYLREAFSPLWGFLYGWALLLVIQSGTIAAVAVGFARYLGVLVPWISPTKWLVRPIDVSTKYAVSLSTQQLVAIVMVIFLTLINTRGIRLGKMIQNVFTSAKTLSLAALIVLGILVGRNADAIAANFSAMWTPVNPATIAPEVGGLPSLTAAAGALGLLVALCVAQVGSLFSSDAWNNITFTAGEVKEPKRNIPLSLAYGTLLVTVLYCLANVAYLCTLTLEQIRTAPDDRVATAALSVVFGPAGAAIMAVAIIISTFGCNNGLILAGARVYYAMAKDSLFFKKTAVLNERHVPSFALVVQCIVTCLIVLPRTRTYEGGLPKIDPTLNEPVYGNLYGQLLDWVVFAVLIFYVLTIAGLFVLRKKRPDAERPYRAFGYPLVPGLYMVAASTIALVLLLYRTKTSLPGLAIVLTGVPVYWLWKRRATATGG
ncbi:MAG TPA: amino acid permease [Thermoanaerobaculia bacterium]|nr:amino acid permease [Thermoanaerobaculia bacterium]